MATGSGPTRGAMFRRGLTRHCPRCGSGHLFKHYMTMVPDCPRCGLHYERESGYWAGALAINMTLTGGLFAIVFVTTLAITLPSVPAVPILAICAPIVVFGPILLYPFSKTIWVAVDRAFLQRLDANERADEQLRRY